MPTSYICKQCSRKTFHDEQWDSLFCAICNTWNEDKCSDAECHYCTKRPDTPLKEDIHAILLEANIDVGFDGVEQLVEFYFELEESE